MSHKMASDKNGLWDLSQDALELEDYHGNSSCIQNRWGTDNEMSGAVQHSLENAFKSVLSRVPAPVVVVTASGPDRMKRGVTCSSFAHISLRPPILSFALNNPSRFHDIIASSRLFAVHMLSKHQVVQSIHFSKAAIDGQCQFDTIPHETGPNNVPLLKDTTAVLLCQPHQHHVVGDHIVWYGLVQRIIHATKTADPLLYYGKSYHSIGDDSFMSAFEHRTLPFEDWTHQAHLRMAWNYISTFGVSRARQLIKTGIKHYNEANKDRINRGYHETVTEFYIHVVAHAIDEHRKAKLDKTGDSGADDETFDDVISTQPHLLERDLVFRYYSEPVLSSPKAKTDFVPPDLQPLPRIE